MIDIELVRSNWGAVADNLARRGVKRNDVKRLHDLDAAWRELTQQTDALRAQQNEANATIADAHSSEKEKLIAAMKNVSSQLTEAEQALGEKAVEREAAWRALPNLLADGVPDGDTQDSIELVAAAVDSDATPTAPSYLTIAGDFIDLERAAKVSGSRFAYLKGPLARLELALISFVFDHLTGVGFEVVIPPVLIKEQAMRGMGYLDHDSDEVYRTQDDLFLVGTSEQSIGAMHMDEVLSVENLPLRYAGFSTCFRREAGSHGKDVKGILRVHQFDKVEMFSFTAPDQSADEHEFLLAQQQALMEALELPYRVLNMATFDLGAPAAKKYDIEAWLPGQGAFRETHSTSNTTDWQARRLNIRVRHKDKRVEVAHMLNGTAIAVGRILIALIENHQQTDGSVVIPRALHSYLPFTEIGTTQ